MNEVRVLDAAELPQGAKKLVKVGEEDVLLVHAASGIAAVQALCPHAKAPLVEGAVCGDRLVCPWHMATFALPTGGLLEPPALHGLKTWPVTVRDGSLLVGTELNTTPKTSGQGAQEPTVLLAGAGAAAAMAAVTLREEGFAGRIVAVDPVADEPVDRTALTKNALAGKLPLAKTALNVFSEAGVERIAGRIVRFSAARHETQLSSGQVVAYDYALIATGSEPLGLPVRGAELAHTIRHTRDVEAILAALPGVREIVVIGTSFIALEAASALIAEGRTITVVGRDALPFARKFGEPVAEALVALHRAKGTRFELEAEVTAITAESVTFVRAGEAETLPAGLVLLGVGVEPSLDFEHDLPLAKHGGGIAVDRTLQAAPHVWVAGDVANVDGTRIEHWRLAEQHGRFAAQSIARAAAGMQLSTGAGGKFAGVPFFWTAHFGKRFGYLGHASEWDEIVYDGDPASLKFLAFYIARGRVQAVLGCGRDTAMATLAEALRREFSLQEARTAVAGL